MPKILFLIILVVVLYLSHAYLLEKMGKYLVFEKPVQKADVMVVLSGDNGERIEAAVELYKKGYSRKILMAGGGKYFGHYYSEYMKNYALELGVPKRAVIEERNALSTFENAAFLIPMIKEKKWQNILIVTSKYHTRRAYKIFEKVLIHDAKLKVNIFILGSDDKIDYQKWWKNHESAEYILIEWAKTIVYAVKYRII